MKISLSENIRPILATIQTVPMPARFDEEAPPSVTPFITLSRQPGAGAWSFAQEFVQAINAANPHGPQWTCWDRELVEKIAADHHLSKRLIESLEETEYSWLNDLFSGMSDSHTDEAMLYHRISTTVLALAQAGRVVIVGGGSAFVTRNLTGGINLRFVAPLDYRIESVERSMQMTPKQAATWVADTEHKRARFYKRFWPRETLEPGNFTLTVNTARVGSDELIAMVMALVQRREQMPLGVGTAGERG